MTSRFAFLAAPVLVFAYGIIRIIDGLDGSRGPGVAWTIGHLAFLGALALFVPVFAQMRAMAGKSRTSTITTIIGYAGIAALAIQFVIDIVAGFMAEDRLGMGLVFEQVKSIPLVEPLVYDYGPFLFYIGQLALAVELAIRRQAKPWTPVLIFLDLLMPIVDKDLIPVGAVFLMISFVSLARLSQLRPQAVIA